MGHALHFLLSSSAAGAGVADCGCWAHPELKEVAAHLTERMTRDPRCLQVGLWEDGGMELIDACAGGGGGGGEGCVAAEVAGVVLAGVSPALLTYLPALAAMPPGQLYCYIFAELVSAAIWSVLELDDDPLDPAAGQAVRVLLLEASGQLSTQAVVESLLGAGSMKQMQVPEARDRSTVTAVAGYVPNLEHPAFVDINLWVLLTGNNSTVFRTALGQRRQPVSGPLGLLLFLATLIAASFAAIRSALVKRGKSCKTCRGFGLQRCRLCLGSGRVDWAAKLKHFDVCPLCMNKRFIVCAECGGHYHRAMFSHRRRQAGGALEPAGSDGFEGPIVLNLAAAGAGAASGTFVTGSSYIVTRSMDVGPGGGQPDPEQHERLSSAGLHSSSF
eukprot:gene14416-14521_t